jgi:HK97 family phage major capsid protein
MAERRDGPELEQRGPEGAEYRVSPSRISGFGGEFTLPAYLIDQFSIAPRPERVLADLVTRFPLKRGIGKIVLPRVIAGSTAGAMKSGGVDASSGLETSQPESEVALISGHLDVAMQALEQSPLGASLDQMMFREMLSAYDAALELQLTTGEGAKDELLGILNGGEGKEKAIEMYQRIGEVFAFVSNNRKRHLEAWLMRGGRWAWISTGEDANTRPLVVPFDSHELTEGINPVGRMIGASLYITESLPKTLGGPRNQDVIVGVRPSDFLLWEEDVPSFNGVEIFTDVLSGALEARFLLRGYAGFIPGRWPSSICTLAGVGMKVPAGF